MALVSACGVGGLGTGPDYNTDRKSSSSRNGWRGPVEHLQPDALAARTFRRRAETTDLRLSYRASRILDGILAEKQTRKRCACAHRN